MAHKGKLFPVLPNRDLSLAPNYLARLPQQFIWQGFSGHGPWASQLNGQTMTLDVLSIDAYSVGTVVYTGSLSVHPTGILIAAYTYQLTHTAQMAEHAFIANDNQYTILGFGVRPLVYSWPYTAIVPPIFGNQSGNYLLDVYGHVEPKKW